VVAGLEHPEANGLPQKEWSSGQGYGLCDSTACS